MQNEKVCPGCGTQWPYFMAKAEAVEEEEDIDVNQPPPEPLARKRSKRSRVFEEDVSNSQEGGSNGSSQVHSSSRKRIRSSQNTVDEESTGPSQSQPMTQAARRAKVEALEDLDEDNAGPSQVTRRATRKSTRLHR